MTWRGKEGYEGRVRFVLGWRGRRGEFGRYCAEKGISRKTGYEWIKRYRRAGLEGLKAESRRPRGEREWYGPECREAVRELRLEHRSWGPKKLVSVLRRRKVPAPDRSTVARWLKAWGLAGRREKRARRGPALERPVGLTHPQRANEVWTVDFKGWFCTRQGQRCEPLTVRDLYSRYCLGIHMLRNQSRTSVQGAMKRIFARYGLPEIIRVDNGAPFASSQGALKLSALSLWWMHLGIAVELTRRGRPGDNASH